jgi:hypothetical protein
LPENGEALPMKAACLVNAPVKAIKKEADKPIEKYMLLCIYELI